MTFAPSSSTECQLHFNQVKAFSKLFQSRLSPNPLVEIAKSVPLPPSPSILSVIPSVILNVILNVILDVILIAKINGTWLEVIQ